MRFLRRLAQRRRGLAQWFRQRWPHECVWESARTTGTKTTDAGVTTAHRDERCAFCYRHRSVEADISSPDFDWSRDSPNS